MGVGFIGKDLFFEVFGAVPGKSMDIDGLRGLYVLWLELLDAFIQFYSFFILDWNLLLVFWPLISSIFVFGELVKIWYRISLNSFLLVLKLQLFIFGSWILWAIRIKLPLDGLDKLNELRTKNWGIFSISYF